MFTLLIRLTQISWFWSCFSKFVETNRNCWLCVESDCFASSWVLRKRTHCLAMSHVVGLSSRVNRLNAFCCAICYAFFMVAFANPIVAFALASNACSLTFMLTCSALEDLAPGGHVVAGAESDGRAAPFVGTISCQSTSNTFGAGISYTLAFRLAMNIAAKWG